MAFSSKKYVSQSGAKTFATRYRAAMAKHPFLLFGLPFMAVIVGGSFVLTPATAIRFEKYDRQVRQMTAKEESEVGINKRKFDMREEYFRLMSKKDIDDWEPKRVKRLPGESDGKL
ncbi:hypothetical protein MKZ38_010120 [Zalerion maritima]|uniref:Cytochrome c oxidase assembly protein COX16, mitochondrial n=1 Tax=Zalerion maritima TaxID=339359 RepID=A0AAD5WVB6_9PEZI|nr:hypothetical protein MKZ38_010120 [Zalerion maritima]